MHKTKFVKRFPMGKPSEYDKTEYLAPPSWDCGWYWGFGYLQNEDIHHHVDGLNRDRNMFNALKEYYGDTLTITNESDLWTFCELMRTFYVLKETAEVLGRGGAHYTTNPCENVILNKKEVTRINEVVLPAIFDAIEDVISKYR
jgi:hypothetical protein